MEYKVNFKNQLAVLENLIIFTILLPIAVWLVGNNKGFENSLFYFYGIFYTANLLVVLSIHLYYFYNSKNIVIIKNIFAEKIIYDYDGVSKTINLDGKEKIEVHLTPSMYSGRKIQIFPFEQYHYAIIITKEANYVITCLVMKDIMKEFDKLGIKYTKKWRFFPFIREESY
jgi:hypothetical protein